MPRARTPEERERVDERLLVTGRELFGRLGLARVTVSDLARGAGIGKGTLYQFYPSKEALFLAIQEREEVAFRATVLEEVEGAATPREALISLLVGVSVRLERHPFLRQLLDPETLAHLQVRLPPERMHRHRRDDEEFFLGLARRWKERGWLHEGVSPQRFFDVLTALFVMSTQAQLVGGDTLRRAAEEIAEALAERWCPG